MYAGHCATRCGLKEHASRSSSRLGARVASLARLEGANSRGFTSSHDRDVWWFRRGRKVSSRARRAANEASTRFVAAWRRAASMRDCASAVRAGRAFALAVTSGLRVVYPSCDVLASTSRGRAISGGAAMDTGHPGRHRRATTTPRARQAIAATLDKGRRGRTGTSRAAAARRAGPSRPTRGGPRTFLYLHSPCAGGGAPPGGSGGRRTSSCAPFFWNSRRAAA